MEQYKNQALQRYLDIQKYDLPSGQLLEGLHTWLRADTGIILDDDDRVNWWIDSVSGNAFGQAGATVRPRYIASDEGNNGYPAVFFTGQDGDDPKTTDRLVSTLAAADWNFLHDGSGMTIIMVARDLNGASNRMVLSTSASGGTVTGFQFYTGTNSVPTTFFASILRDQATVNYASAQAATPLDTNSVIVHSNGLSRSPANIFRRNATTISSGNYASAPDPETAGDATNTLTIGAGNAAGQAADKIKVSELIIYDRTLSLTEIQAVENYLNRKYEIY